MAATGGWTVAGALWALAKLMNDTGTIPTDWYVGLATTQVAAGDDLSTIDELTTPGYERLAVTFGTPSGTNPVLIANTNLVTFDLDPGEDPPAVMYGFLTDEETGAVGPIFYRWSANAAVDGSTGEDYQINIGALQLRLITVEG